MRKSFIALCLCCFSCFFSFSQKATVKEYNKVYPTYPFSDPDPIPEMGKVYPYFRFDGYAVKPIQKEWKVVELENEYLRVIILPEIGGKIWTAIEKSTGKPFIYDNSTVKFRDIAMRGPWTSGGIEANYGIIGHTPNTATPVDYVILRKPDGSVSCVIGVLDLLTRTSWRIDINLPADKAYFTTSSLWYNPTSFEQPYYTWMNAGLKAADDLQFFYPGTKHLGHNGEYADWPFNPQQGTDISWYRNNDFGGPKSYHIFGKRSDFFGAYWHNEDFGMGRYSTRDDKAGRKLWIWGLSGQGMIWEKLLTDHDGQYVELQSGRMFNQASPGSSFTPFKNKGFLPHTTDIWTEYWFPVLKTKGISEANSYGSLHLKPEDGMLKIYFSPLQKIDDELVVRDGENIIYTKRLRLNTLQSFADSFKINSGQKDLVATLGKNKLSFDLSPTAQNISRPVQSPIDFDWNSAYGLYLQGKENIRERRYAPAEENLRASLAKEPYYVPALTGLSLVLCRNMEYEEALATVKKALSVDTYDPAANYYYGVINTRLGNTIDAKDGFDIAALSLEYRSAAYTSLARIYFKEGSLPEAIDYAYKAVDFNKYAIDAYQTLAAAYRVSGNTAQAKKILDTLRQYDPLNHFARFEQYLLEPSASNQSGFTSLIRNEMPVETYLELAIGYYELGLKSEAIKMLQLAPKNVEVLCWQAFLEDKPLNLQGVRPELVFSFRAETEEVLTTLLEKNDHWIVKYQLGLIKWNNNDLREAKRLFDDCGDQPDYSPFYAGRAKLNAAIGDNAVLKDLLKARDMDKEQWRHGKNLIVYYLDKGQFDQALTLAKEYQNKFPGNDVINILYVKSLMQNKQFSAANAILKQSTILPNEGATEGRRLYKETNLMLALEQMEKKKYKKALEYIAAARLWPENLGVGKPYDEEIDDRLENWLAYESYTRTGNTKSARKMLDNILAFSLYDPETGRPVHSVNNLVTAWAMKKAGKANEALTLLEDRVHDNPSNELAKWVLNAYNGEFGDLAGRGNRRGDEDYRILTSLLHSGWRP
ncbi:MAG TPA: DUF5107 domain-containing protein [Flavitalea sp.]|nr:DUF5107 domain-containing protein [Flavitalea sp.]